MRRVADRLARIAIIIVFVSVLGVAHGGERLPTARFALENVNFQFDLPAGYCMPTGKEKEILEAIGGMDPANMTHFTIVPCDHRADDPELSAWGMLKTPRASIGKRVPLRETLVRELGSEIKHPNMFDDPSRLAGKTFKDVFGVDAELRSHLESLASDSYAAYLGGTISIALAGEKQVIALVGAATVVRGHVFFYYKYRKYTAPGDIATLLQQVKPEIRSFVLNNPG